MEVCVGDALAYVKMCSAQQHSQRSMSGQIYLLTQTVGTDWCKICSAKKLPGDFYLIELKNNDQI